jgi:hypothetical protein
MREMKPDSLILACDRAGNPSAWLNTQTAIHLATTERLLAALGAHSRIVYGGVNASSGRRSRVVLSSILLTNARVRQHRWEPNYEPPLTNKALFARDGYLCLYCGNHFTTGELTRDHVMPTSRGGANAWTNVASACRNCNQRKGNRTPAEWGIELIAVPYAPCYAQHLMLNGKTMLGDQMDFLKLRVKRS